MSLFSQTLRLVPRPELRLRLSPAMRQSLHVLRLAEGDLRSYIENELASNPFLEEARRVRPSVGERQAEKRKYFEEAAQAGTPSLQERLLRQMGLLRFSPAQIKLGAGVIGNLNDDGYLAAPLPDIARDCGLPLRDAAGVLSAIQRFDPPGIAARDLEECLLLQLRSMEPPPIFLALAERIVKNHLRELKLKKYAHIAKRLKAPLSKVRQAARGIRRLDPRPGLRFSASRPLCVVPDISVHRYAGKKYKVVDLRPPRPRVRIDVRYQQLLAEKGPDSEEGRYLRERLQAALSLVKALNERERTLEKLARCLVEEQRGFFEKGPSHLKPLTMRKAAERLGLNKSTVSRAAADKYLETPHGVFAFKFFFGVGPANGIQSRIRTMISRENKRRPLKDGEIVRLLRLQGVRIARRTVAKYRDRLRLQPAHLRKE